MPGKLRLVSCLTLLCLGSACAAEQREPSPPASCPEPEPAPASVSATGEDQLVEQIDGLARRARELYDVPGLAIAVVHEGELILARGYGERELGSGQLVDERSSFQIASNTKAFVATAVGLLVAEGVLDWDDPVHEHLPELLLWSEQATADLRVRDLLSHRAGLATWAGDLMWISSAIERDELLARLRHLPAAAGLRERYGYSNLMFVVAGELIEAKTGQPWEAFVRARLLQPLGMDAVATGLAELEGRDNLAAPHIEVDGQWRVIERLDVDVTGAAGALDASVLDISQWLRMQLAEGELEGEQIVPAEIIHDTRTPHIFIPVRADDFYEPPRHLRAYGLGWSLEDYRGRLLVAHGGGLPGMSSRVLMVPEAELGIVVLTNSESRASALLALSVADLFLADEAGKDYLAAFAPSEDEDEDEDEDEGEPRPEKAGEAGPVAVPLPARLAGSYENPLLGAAKIEAEDGELWFFAHEHGGLRCRLAEQARPGPSDTSVRVPCTWLDPNMGVSVFTIETARPRELELRFRVRPDFYDPLEYTFERAGRGRARK